MTKPATSRATRHAARSALPGKDDAVRIALNEYELAARWGLSVKTLRRWRQEQLGPIYCKFGARVTYLIAEIEAFERRAARHSTSVAVQRAGV